MFVQNRPLGDPALRAFAPGAPVLPAGIAPLDEAAAAAASPLARRLLRIDGVAGVALEADEIMVRRADGAEWHVLKPPLLGAIMAHYGSGDPLLAEPAILEVLEFLDDRIRPAVAAYGGEVVFRGLDGGVLALELRGGGGPRKQSMIGSIVVHHLSGVAEVAWAGEKPAADVPESVFEEKPGGPQGPEAAAVLRLLEERVNPAVAAHGGRIVLMDVVGRVAYLRMEGGCQGCSASAVTLQQGVRDAILAEVPAVEEVVDVTDHAAGSDPFYA